MNRRTFVKAFAAIATAPKFISQSMADSNELVDQPEPVKKTPGNRILTNDEMDQEIHRLIMKYGAKQR